jgi:hypothetical protein
MNLRMLAVAAVVITALAGCGGGGSRSHAQPSASPSINGHAAALDLAKCMRANGYPNFPDPVQDDQGSWTIPNTPGVPVSATVCDALLRTFKQYETSQRQAHLDLPKRREFAKCMRAQGVPDFPDPDEEGNFELPDRVKQADRNNDPTLRAADKACAKYLPPQPPKPSH